MKTAYLENEIEVTGLGPVSLPDTLDCGQCFRWKPLDDGTWQGIAYGKECRVRENGDGITFCGVGEDDFRNIWVEYFDLDRDYKRLREVFSEDALLKRACEFAPGIRLLKQEPWEAFITFIISQNNNVARIRGLVEKVCAAYGEPVGETHAFPTAERLAGVSEGEFAALGCGYRAEYLSEAAKEVCDGRLDLETLRDAPLCEARERLLKVKGIGPKVADCVLLFGLGRLDRCPADVWMKRVLAAMGGSLPACVGDCGGIAQQYLFHYVRKVPDALCNCEAGE